MTEEYAGDDGQPDRGGRPEGAHAGAQHDPPVRGDPPVKGDPQDQGAAAKAPSPCGPPRQGLLLLGLTLMNGEGAGPASLYLPADKVDGLISAGTWRPGQLNDVETYPPKHAWPPAWHHLKD
ncbi:MAG: hypothetical protein WCF04_09055 [Candidatus Nanopelagicales bacterium]